MTPIRIIGRSSSHYTRVTRLFAHELRVPYELVPIYDLTQVEQNVYGANPALKLPTLERDDGSRLFGTENICRALHELSGASARVVWPEQLRGDISRNAQEMVWHGMAAQVQLVLGVVVGKLPADHFYFEKARAGFEGALRWLDEHLEKMQEALPRDRQLSLFEVTLYCLLEHVRFRPTVALSPFLRLTRFSVEFGGRPAAEATHYHFDQPPR